MQQKGAVNRTKIIATLGPASAAQTTMRKMIRAGVDVARVNFSHGTADANLELVQKLRTSAEAENKSVAVMQDLQGTKLRVGLLPEGGIQLLEGSMRTLLAGAEQAEGDMIPVPAPQLATGVKRGDRILLRDGQLELEVMHVDGRRVTSKVLLGGVLASHQGLAVPDRKSTRLNSSHIPLSRMPSSA